MTGVVLMLVFAIIFIAIAEINKSKFKGKIGEARVSTVIKDHLSNSSYRLIENITIPGKGGTTQIDHIVVSPFGIFVIEVKNMKGWIYGGEKQRKWTQKFPRKSFPFQNPLHQNYRHLKTLSAVLAIPESHFHSIVCFVGDSKFKTSLPENVLRPSQLVHYIKNYSDVVLSEEATSTATRKIEKARQQRSRKTEIEHVEQLKSRHQKSARG